ncbi:MAG: flagellar biosynthesis protein FlhB, partial [Rhodospirillales bacterium]
MADEDDASKTEEPTDKKLGKARDQGNVARSEEVKTWAILLTSTVLLSFLGPMVAGQVRDLSFAFIEHPHAFPQDFENLRQMFMRIFIDIGLILWPTLLALVIVAVGVNLAQSGLLWATEKIKPDLSKISPIKGLKNKFSLKSVVEFLKGIVKISIVAAVSLAISIPFLADVELLPGKDLQVALDRIHLIALLLAGAAVAVLTILAVADYVYQRYNFRKEMKMTKQEVKDEHKTSEGDPQVKAKIRQLRFERSQRRMMAAVPKADVVITNPTHYACALEYKMENMTAPRLVAKGVDSIAFKIREIAEFHDIPIVENPPLARALHAAVELDQEIPPEHYKAVAEVIGYVMRLRGDLPPRALRARAVLHLQAARPQHVGQQRVAEVEP